jgi:hypothetical protein
LTTNWGLCVTSGAPTGTGVNYMIDFRTGDGTYKGAIEIVNGAVGLYTVSDARLKQNITQTGVNALKMLKDIEVVDYNFTKSAGERHTGYIAQDVQKVLPEMVTYNEKADVYAISTTTLIPILHKAIQEQQAVIEAQAKRIDDLEKAVNMLLNPKK